MHFLSVYLTTSDNYSKEFESRLCICDDAQEVSDACDQSSSGNVNASVQSEAMKKKIEKNSDLAKPSSGFSKHVVHGTKVKQGGTRTPYGTQKRIL